MECKLLALATSESKDQSQNHLYPSGGLVPEKVYALNKILKCLTLLLTAKEKYTTGRSSELVQVGKEFHFDLYIDLSSYTVHRI